MTSDEACLVLDVIASTSNVLPTMKVAIGCKGYTTSMLRSFREAVRVVDPQSTTVVVEEITEAEAPFCNKFRENIDDCNTTMFIVKGDVTDPHYAFTSRISITRYDDSGWTQTNLEMKGVMALGDV